MARNTSNKNEPTVLSDGQIRELEDHAIDMRLDEAGEYIRIKEFLKDPFGAFYKYPSYAMFFSGPLALIFLIIGLNLTWGTIRVDDVAIFSVVIFITPPAITYYKKRHHVNKIEEFMPNLLRDLAEMSRAGLTLPAAVNTVSKGEYGEMTGEIRTMNASMSWGVSFENTLENFAARLNTPLISRAVSLITQANRAGGKVSFVLDAAARDASEIKTLERERRGNMAVYVVICYMAFFVFIFVILMLSSKFVPVMAEAGQAASAAGAGNQFIGSFDPGTFTRILFHASVIQGFVSGLVAGQMGEGEVSAGLKHSLILMITAWAAFTLMI
ncbi:MAG: type II secretion system F family protein [Methanosarcinaceae archaeon]|nr:type II secretion system F family protein [Methanosarcinaceae archaeon]